MKYKKPNQKISFWIGLACLILFLAISASASGFIGVLLMLGIFLFFTALYSLLIGRPSWLGIPSRKTAALGLVGSLVVTFGSANFLDTEPSNSPDTVISAPVAGFVAPGEQKISDEQTASIETTQNEVEASSKTAEEARTSEQKLALEKNAKVEEAKAVDAAKKADEDKTAAVAQKTEDAKNAKAAAAAKKAAEAKVADAAAKKAKAATSAQKALKQTAAEKQTAAKPSTPKVSGFVHPGSFCSGGTGVSKKGKPMVCRVASDGRMRWKSR